jgi:hypothetical protein
MLVAFLAIKVMYKASQSELVEHAQKAQVEQQTRPRDLELLKRPAVRAACTTHSDWTMEDCQTIDQKRVAIGMTAEQVRLSWGKPQQINATISSQTHREQWVYGVHQYLYMHEGVLRSMQVPR